MQKIWSILMGVILVCPLYAQTEMDALRFSQTQFGSTARTMGIGGAFGALGADFSSASHNPAGLGLYRSSEISFSPGFTTTRHRSDFLGNSGDEMHYNMNFGSVGFVYTNLYVDSRGNNMHDKWRAISIALGFNKLNQYHSRQYFEGFNAQNSMLNFYAEQLRGTHPSAINPGSVGFEPNMAYQTYLVDPVEGDSTRYISRAANGMVQQSGTIDERGGMNELTMSLAANYDDRLYMGATFGFPRIYYSRELNYSEKDIMDSIPNFRSFDLTREYQMDGWGFNFKGGLAFRATNWLRLGIAVHSPTIFSISDEYDSEMESRLETESYSENSPSGKFDYSLTTPWRMIGSLAFIVNKYGFISVDYEFVDYSQAFYNFGSGFQLAASERNKTIRNTYGQASNIRVGAEAVIDNMRLRAGYALYGSPFKSGVETAGGDQSQSFLNFGIGFREENFYIDLGFSRRISKDFLTFYSLEEGGGAGSLNETIKNRALVTIGFKL